MKSEYANRNFNLIAILEIRKIVTIDRVLFDRSMQ